METNQRFIKSALSTGLPFGVGMGIFFMLRFRVGPVGGIIMGLFAGVFFGVLMAMFTEAQRKKMEIQGDQLEGHPILHQGPANHFLGVESRGGWLVLTTNQLLFRSHGKNIQNSDLQILLGDISSARTKRTLGIIPN